jgi:hypothetical protein
VPPYNFKSGCLVYSFGSVNTFRFEPAMLKKCFRLWRKITCHQPCCIVLRYLIKTSSHSVSRWLFGTRLLSRFGESNTESRDAVIDPQPPREAIFLTFVSMFRVLESAKLFVPQETRFDTSFDLHQVLNAIIFSIVWSMVYCGLQPNRRLGLSSVSGYQLSFTRGRTGMDTRCGE